MKPNPIGARIVAGVASHAVEQLASLAQTAIQQAAQPRVGPGTQPPVQPRQPAAQPRQAEAPHRSAAPAALPRRAAAPQRSAAAPPPRVPPPQSKPAAADGPVGAATSAVSHSVQDGISAGHEIAAMMAELSQAAAQDSATKKAADQLKTAAQ